MVIKRLLVLGVVVLLLGCEAKDLVVDQTLDSKSTPEGIAAPLSSEEYQSLKPAKQYQVANKLAATLYKGVPADEFFNFNIYGSDLRTTDVGNAYIADMREKIASRVQNKSELANLVNRRHTFDNSNIASVNDSANAKGLPLATIIEYPVSRDQFEAWMAYILANTILFSPAEEIASANYLDIQKVNDNLVKSMRDDASIQSIVLAHMKSEANWRRFRSPEDNTREMIEIYLGLFDRDADVPKASIACKNWYLSDDSKDDKYELIIELRQENTEPQRVLDSWVTTCEDFYDVVSNHPLLIPRITTFLVDRFFSNSSSSVRSEMVKDIVAQNPVRFNDIFTAIIFSREYLMNNEKPKSFEETVFNISDRVGWRYNDAFIQNLVSTTDGTNPNLKTMNQPAMSLKLGRFMMQPLDSLSFAFYHQAIREQVLTKIDPRWGAGWDIDFYSKGDLFEQNEYIDFLFLSILSRKATQDEIDGLRLAFTTTGDETNRSNQVEIVFDYISRLPDLYYFKKITSGEAQ